ncbi:MAG: DUF4416 family protein [Deferribacteres bacterium]|nr:DUF4416 family protein [candidate division KSB1 bacterium]MCB9500901.1 DUF4416 family protein [Deferribacteres bacterium]
MAEVIKVPPVKLLVAALYVESKKLQAAQELLCQEFGPIDFTSSPYPFVAAYYYAPEMGEPINRILFSFENLIDASELARVKHTTNVIEKKTAIESNRCVNLDSGYLDFDKLVLASMKKGAQKIYVGSGVWADMNLMYSKGRFQSFAWTFPDFAEGIYEKPLLRIREIYKAQWRVLAKSNEK